MNRLQAAARRMVALPVRLCPHAIVSRFASILLFSLLSATFEAHASPWNLPQSITDSNARVQYRYIVQGSPTRGIIKGIRGKAWSEGGDYQRIRADLEIPVPKLSDALGEMASAFGGLLDAVQLPPARVSLLRIRGICSPREVESAGACKGTAEGTAEFGQSKRPISFPVVVSRSNRSFRIEGAGSFDPSQAQGGGSAAMLGMIEQADVSFQIELPDPAG